MKKMFSWFTTAILFCVLFGACSSGSDSESNGDECEHPTAQPASAPCCESHGVDACGAGLTCAALDGRKQATCYAERSRETGQECTAGIQCFSNGCSDKGKCQPGPGDDCDHAVGCGNDGDGRKYVCGYVSSKDPVCCACSGDDHCFSGC